jgi:uroporphyrinogen III methyltransferase/synthase
MSEQQSRAGRPAPGRVYLVGAGPGDPELITLKGLRCLQQAEVVVYDRLANEALLQHVPASTIRVFAGKAPGAHALSQEQINALLVQHGRAGRRVVRLKGGDPYVFGRGGEEAEALVAAGVPYEVVPGITSAIAAPAYAGIPLTHRDVTPAFTVVTGHEDPAKDASTVPWPALAAGADTLVFLMGVGRLALIAEQLVAHGRAPDTPVAVVRRGTWPDQQVVAATLSDIAERVAEIGLTAPAVTVVGNVVALAQTLGWSGAQPLAGRRVLVTRAREQASALSALMRSFGATVLEFPAIRIVPAEDYAALDGALAALSAYTWVCFTSVNAVEAVDRRLRAIGRAWDAVAGARLAAIGPATARALRAHGCAVAYVPERFLADEVAAGLPDVEGARILLARADIADARLVERLQARGARVDQFVAYRTLVADQDAGPLRARLAGGEIDVVTFASSSTVRNLCRALGEDAPELLRRTLIACIGPVTAATAREEGLEPAVVAGEHTIPGLVRAIRERLAACT